MVQLRNDLPSRPRAIYKNNPIIEVVCAIKFPRVLGLSQDMPSEFQRLVSSEYPLVEVVEPLASFRLIGANPAPTVLDKPLHRTFKFKSEDTAWVLTLEPELLALTCSKYERWEDFFPRFVRVAQHVFRLYGIPLVSRVGLRFQSVLVPSRIGLSGSPWRQIVQPSVLATLEYFSGPLSDLPPLDQTIVLEIEPGKMRLKLAKVANGDDVGLLIDTDCFVDSENFRSLGDCTERIIKLHEYSGRIFQSCISDDVHDRLEPRPVG